MFERTAEIIFMFVIVLFCLFSVGSANADSYQYTLSRGTSPSVPLVVDDDLEVMVNGKPIFVDNDGFSTMDGRATWNGTPITFSAAPGDKLRIRATNSGGIDSELSPLYLHANGQSVKLSDGIAKASSNVYEFFDERFIISIPPVVSISSPKEGEELTWSPEGYNAKGTYFGLDDRFNLYLTVYPLTSNQYWVQNSPTIRDNGTWEVTVYFGTKEFGAGEKYELCAIITEETLDIGLIDNLPQHVAKSEVRVSRIEAIPLIPQKYLFGGIIGSAILLIVILVYRKEKKRSQLPEEAKETRGARKPKLHLNITSDIGLKVDRWEQLHTSMTNVGGGKARNVKLTLSGPIEIGGVKTIPELERDATKEVVVGIKPTEYGNLPLQISVSYTDENGRTFEITDVAYIRVAKEDETVSEQPTVIFNIGSIGEVLGDGAIRTGDVGLVKGDIGTIERSAKKCPNCGREVSEEERFCPECGDELK